MAGGRVFSGGNQDPWGHRLLDLDVCLLATDRAPGRGQGMAGLGAWVPSDEDGVPGGAWVGGEVSGQGGAFRDGAVAAASSEASHAIESHSGSPRTGRGAPEGNRGAGLPLGSRAHPAGSKSHGVAGKRGLRPHEGERWGDKVPCGSARVRPGSPGHPGEADHLADCSGHHGDRTEGRPGGRRTCADGRGPPSR